MTKNSRNLEHKMIEISKILEVKINKNIRDVRQQMEEQLKELEEILSKRQH